MHDYLALCRSIMLYACILPITYIGVVQSIKRTLKTKEVLYTTFIGCSIQTFQH